MEIDHLRICDVRVPGSASALEESAYVRYALRWMEVRTEEGYHDLQEEVTRSLVTELNFGSWTSHETPPWI